MKWSLHLYGCILARVGQFYLFFFHFGLSIHVSDSRKCVGDACVISIKRICLQVSVCLLIWTKAQRVKLTDYVRRFPHIYPSSPGLSVDYRLLPVPFTADISHMLRSSPIGRLCCLAKYYMWRTCWRRCASSRVAAPTAEFKVGDRWSARWLMESYNGAISELLVARQHLFLSLSARLLVAAKSWLFLFDGWLVCLL